MPARACFVAAAAALAVGTSLVQAATYNLVEQSAGLTFFNGWTFYDHYDNTTSGDVIFVNSSFSDPAPLAYVNDAGNAIIKVSTETVIYDNKRNSVKITQDNAYDVGTVWVFDAVHVPVGCSVWPAFWTTAATWPVGGEIDIFEGVNLQTKNQYAMHTVAGCSPAHDASQLTGSIGEANCNATNGAGCTIVDSSTASYGTGFNAAGGGAWVTELAEEGVSIWFIPRGSMPSTLNANASTIDTSSLGTPTAYWPSSGCAPIADFLSHQQAIIDITLCGVWAGTASTLESTGCAAPVAPETCYTTYVLNGNEDFAEAYFEISYMNVFSSSSDVASVSTNPTSTASRSLDPSATGTQTANAAAAASSSSTGTSGAVTRAGSSAWVGAVTLGAMGIWAMV